MKYVLFMKYSQPYGDKGVLYNENTLNCELNFKRVLASTVKGVACVYQSILVSMYLVKCTSLLLSVCQSSSQTSIVATKGCLIPFVCVALVCIPLWQDFASFWAAWFTCD